MPEPRLSRQTYWGNYTAEPSPAYITDTYAPEASCLFCNAKLSKYREQVEPGEWEEFCAPCSRKGHNLTMASKACSVCGEMFVPVGARDVCVDCVVPSTRMERAVATGQRSMEAARLHGEGFQNAEIAIILNFNSGDDARKAISRFNATTYMAQKEGWI